MKKKPTIILLPGLGYSREIWQDVIPHLDLPGHEVHALDLASYGSRYQEKELNFDTYIPFVDKILDTCNLLPPYVFIGYSLGGLIALKYSAAKPENISKLVLISTPLIDNHESISPMYSLLCNLTYLCSTKNRLISTETAPTMV